MAFKHGRIRIDWHSCIILFRPKYNNKRRSQRKYILANIVELLHCPITQTQPPHLSRTQRCSPFKYILQFVAFIFFFERFGSFYYKSVWFFFWTCVVFVMHCNSSAHIKNKRETVVNINENLLANSFLFLISYISEVAYTMSMQNM